MLLFSSFCVADHTRTHTHTRTRTHGHTCSTKIRHHYFPALVTWSVMENNLSYFLLPYCLTSACPPCPSALARPSWPVRRVPSALARPPWPVCPGPSAMARLACQATSRPSPFQQPALPPAAFPSARRICQGALYCTFHCFSYVWLQTVKWIKCTLLSFLLFFLCEAPNCKVE